MDAQCSESPCCRGRAARPLPGGIHRIIAIALLALGVFSLSAFPDETDQFLAWGVDIEDAAPALNVYVNGAISTMLDVANGDPFLECDCESLTAQIFANIYLDRFRAPLLEFIVESRVIETYPPRDVPDEELREMSIYRNVVSPMVRMTRTIRIGDVYLGVDKLAHLFGIGRRYYVHYLRNVRSGIAPDEAERMTYVWGASVEDSLLGTWVNGIFSYADIEANAQGLRMARAFCEGESPLIQFDGFRWVASRKMDIREFVTPGLDESANPPYYDEDLRALVLPVLAERYRDKAQSEQVVSRFRKYRQEYGAYQLRWAVDSPTPETYAAYRTAFLEALAITESDAAAPFDIYPD